MIGRLLQGFDLTTLPGYDPSITVETTPFYNGRERSIALTLNSWHEVEDIGKRPTFVVVFGEHRSTDAAFIDFWTIDSMPFNHIDSQEGLNFFVNTIKEKGLV